MKKTKITIFTILIIILLTIALVGCTDNKDEIEGKATIVGIEAKLVVDTKFKVDSNFDISKIEVTAHLSDKTSRKIDTMAAVSVNNNVKFKLDTSDNKFKPNESGIYMLDSQMKFTTEGVFVLTASYNGFATNFDLTVYAK